jgi:predicted aconitase with swiveling domain
MWGKTLLSSRVGRRLFVSAAATACTISFFGGVEANAGAASYSVAACTGSNLVGAFVRNQVATGHVMTTISITNVGSSKCQLGGYTGLIGLRNGKRYKLKLDGHGTFGGNLRATVLPPRMSGALIVGTGDLCSSIFTSADKANKYSGLILVLPIGRGNVSVPGLALDTSCYLTESQLGWRQHFSIEDV